jgi:hypothetical protein
MIERVKQTSHFAHLPLDSPFQHIVLAGSENHPLPDQDILPDRRRYNLQLGG